ncbi:MAG: ATP-binding protein [Defluviitaleaceae bacterium]|nr:ATP-binding protein [Defluviitaleaceae bacterium]
MKKRLFLYTILIIFAGLISFLVVSVYVTNRNNLNIAKSTVEEITHILAELYHDGIDLQKFVNAGENTRITVISSTGRLLADNRPQEAYTDENYLLRPEIIAAMHENPEVFLRYSHTRGADFIYYALKVGGGDDFIFIRAAIPATQIDAYVMQTLPLLIALLGTLALICFLVVRGMTNKILMPFSAIEKKLRKLARGENSPILESYDEINKITREIDDVAHVLQNTLSALNDEKNKLSFILDSIGDGILVVDGNERILLTNPAALMMFNSLPDIMGRKTNYLVSCNDLNAKIRECVKKSKNILYEAVLNGRYYLVKIKRLPDTELTMVVLADITENRENAKRREEFFANASHELKTPLTAIRGFNELSAINNRDENLEKYIAGITRETNRMINLISDMLNLSELENTEEVKNLVPVSLAKTVAEVRETISGAIDDKGIHFTTSGDAIISAEQHHVFDIVKNLIENAVRYNKHGGKVTVTISKSPSITVSDNGIGISPDEHTKIFERFYQVEKNRSSQSTGLGLSIVKHVCALYGWKLSLKSKPAIGTDVAVEF